MKLIVFLGYPDTENTWEPIKGLTNCLKKIVEFQYSKMDIDKIAASRPKILQKNSKIKKKKKNKKSNTKKDETNCVEYLVKWVCFY